MLLMQFLFHTPPLPPRGSALVPLLHVHHVELGSEHDQLVILHSQYYAHLQSGHQLRQDNYFLRLPCGSNFGLARRCMGGLAVFAEQIPLRLSHQSATQRV